MRSPEVVGMERIWYLQAAERSVAGRGISCQSSGQMFIVLAPNSSFAAAELQAQQARSRGVDVLDVRVLEVLLDLALHPGPHVLQDRVAAGVRLEVLAQDVLQGWWWVRMGEIC